MATVPAQEIFTPPGRTRHFQPWLAFITLFALLASMGFTASPAKGNSDPTPTACSYMYVDDVYVGNTWKQAPSLDKWKELPPNKYNANSRPTWSSWHEHIDGHFEYFRAACAYDSHGAISKYGYYKIHRSYLTSEPTKLDGTGTAIRGSVNTVGSYKCATFIAKVIRTLGDAEGPKLAEYVVEQYACWNGTRVISASAAESCKTACPTSASELQPPAPTCRGWAAGDSFGWSFDSNISTSANYEAWNNSGYGRWKSQCQGKFPIKGPTGSFGPVSYDFTKAWTPSLTLRIQANGTAYVSGNGYSWA